MNTTAPRKNFKLEDQWDLSSIFTSVESFEENLNYFLTQPSTARWAALLKYKNTLHQELDHIKIILDLYCDYELRLTKLYTYAHLKHDEDLNEDSWKVFFQKVTLLYQDFMQHTAWIEPEILALDQAILDKLLHEASVEPYRFYLETLAHKKQYTLPAEQEELISLTSLSMGTAQKTFSLLNNVDMTFDHVLDSQGKEHPLTQSSYRLFQRSPDRTLRKNAFLKLHQEFGKYQNTFAELLMGHVQQHIFEVKARGYDNSLMAALHSKNIPNQVYHNLIDTVRSKAGDLHHYMRVRKEILNINELHLYDLQLPPTEQASAEIPYEQAMNWVVESVAPLGSHYQKVLGEGLKQKRWVDRYENLHKRSGAYSSGCYGSHPYILMNYKGTLNDVFTLAHEAGHSMHTYLSNQYQPFHYSKYPIFVAEVASIFNESLLMNYLLNKSSSADQELILLHERIEEFRATLFRQTMFAEFELYIHDRLERAEPLTANLISDYYYQLNRDYYGPHVELDKEVSIEWARIPHFYSNFYVYQYATGLAAAMALSQKVLSQEKGACEAYLKFLQSGSHAYPIDLLKIAGVDMSSKEPLEMALDVFKKLIEKLSEKTKPLNINK